MTFWTRAKLFSPLLVRLLARHKRGRPLTDDEIVKSVSGLSHFEVQTLSWKTDWDGVAIDTMQLFLVACDFDFENREDMKRIEDYLAKRPTFKYLQQDPQWKDRWMPMLITWRENYKGICSGLAGYHPGLHALAHRLTPLMQKQKKAA